MSSIDHAFVRAFARRTRPSRDTSGQHANPVESANREAGQLQSDPAAAEGADVWIDGDGKQLLRSDTAADSTVPNPHLGPAPPIRPAEHFRCDYVFGAVKEIPATEADEESEVVAGENVDPMTAQPATITEPSAAVSEQPAAVSEQPADISAEQLTSDEPAAVAESTGTAEATAFATEASFVASQIEHDLEQVTPDANEADGFEAAWEVDMFEIPSTTADLFFDEEFFQDIASRMREAVNDGLKSLVVTSAHSGEGRSTVAVGIAIAAAATGLNVALVDGDTEDPTLADDLRLDLEYGWVDTLRGGTPINQVAVASIQDGVVFFPLIPSAAKAAGASASEVEQLMQTLTDQFDLVVIDGPTCAMPRILQFAALADTAIIARDPSRTDDGTIDELSYRLRASGVQGVGIVENFS